jgi:hypothetical protein
MDNKLLHIKLERDWDRNIARVWLDGVELTPLRSQKVQNHSPDGFEWGYRGSGPTQLALAICLTQVPDTEDALMMMFDFRDSVVAKWQRGDGVFEVTLDFQDWLREWRRERCR